MGGRAVEGTGLENRQGFTLLVGSNPTPSAISWHPFIPDGAEDADTVGGICRRKLDCAIAPRSGATRVTDMQHDNCPLCGCTDVVVIHWPVGRCLACDCRYELPLSVEESGHPTTSDVPLAASDCPASKQPALRLGK